MNYAGDVTVHECWNALCDEKDSQLLDVRTVPEWQFVGVPSLEPIGKRAHLIEWQSYPEMSVNPSFVRHADESLGRSGAKRENSIFVICRSGVRSMEAAAALSSCGYTRVYNVVGGFEGEKNNEGHRGTLSGWKFEGCPWIQ